MKAKELKKKYLEFFREKQHAIISSASLIPEHDPTVLFTTAGMHPLVPYLMGQPHPQGRRLANCQKCIRTGDIDEVGDPSHLTFFEMLGNWSLGDYFKEEAIKYSFEFLTGKKWLGIDKSRLSITCFRGDNDSPKDEESAGIWESLGIPRERIFFLPKKDNWWGPAGKTGPCGPDTEIFYDTGKEPCSSNCMPGCPCGRYFEIWNDVFMQYNKTADSTYEQLRQKNVDTGMGLERTAAVLQGKPTVYGIGLFQPIISRIKKLSKIQSPDKSQQLSIRIITDHIRASTFILGDDLGIAPSNLDQGYILRRFIRRSIRHGKSLGIEKEFLSELAEIVIGLHKADYHELGRNRDFILNHLREEDAKFRKTLEKGLHKFERLSEGSRKISGKDSFLLFQSFGFPLEMTVELAGEKGIEVDRQGFHEEFKKHQELSRIGAEKRFKGGLGDHSAETTRLHTATHLLNQALREVLKADISQRGSNITPERLRFDFNFSRKLSKAELQKIEDWVNRRIAEAIPVKRQEMTVKEAKQRGAQGIFGEKYGEKVFVYSIGDKSIEICGGPHVENTRDLGIFKIKKEESSAAGVRRIKAVLE
ncbi:alanine--tRNA ligase [Candidatus Woesearchaeota archaeon]|nr:alanine--tRNA ligase [Candidatus Woesearchaeota archaeon]